MWTYRESIYIVSDHPRGEPPDIGRHRGLERGQGRGRRVRCWAGADREGIHHNRQVGREGPSIIGENCKIGPNAYIGRYKALGDRCQISAAEIDDSIVMEGSTVSVERKFVRSMIGKGSRVLNSNGLIPKGERLVVGENATIYLWLNELSGVTRLCYGSFEEGLMFAVSGRLQDTCSQEGRSPTDTPPAGHESWESLFSRQDTPSGKASAGPCSRRGT